jgi:hypothetical protein
LATDGGAGGGAGIGSRFMEGEWAGCDVEVRIAVVAELGREKKKTAMDARDRG